LDQSEAIVKTLRSWSIRPADFRIIRRSINGFSELMAEVFGEDAGVGTRSAVGMGSLPGTFQLRWSRLFDSRP